MSGIKNIGIDAPATKLWERIKELERERDKFHAERDKAIMQRSEMGARESLANEQLATANALLRELEWGWLYSHGGGYEGCPVCECEKSHAPDCCLAAHLKGQLGLQGQKYGDAEN